MKRLSLALAVLSLAIPASAQRAAVLLGSQTLADGEGSKLVYVERTYATESSLVPTTHGCGVTSSQLTERLYAPYLDLAPFGGSGSVANANSNPAVTLTQVGAYTQTGPCPAGFPESGGDSDFAYTQLRMHAQFNAFRAWAGRYEISYQWISAPFKYTSTGDVGRTSAGCYHYVPAAADTGTVQIIVTLANNTASSKTLALRHPAVADNARFGEFNTVITGTRTMQLPTGRTLDFYTGSGLWNPVTVPAYGMPANKYYVVVSGAEGTVISITSDPANTDGGPEYDGPPGESSWWEDMLSSAFVPTTTSLSGISSSVDSFKNWGPFGYVTAFFGLFNGTLETPSEQYMTMRLLGPPVVGGGTPLDFTMDFRDPNTDPPPIALSNPPYTQGTPYGTLRAWLRTLVGWSVYGLGAVGLFRWLRPGQTV